MTPVNKIFYFIFWLLVALPVAFAGWVAFVALCVRVAQAWGWL